MFPPIFEVCKADSTVTNLLGVNPTRIWPFGEAPEGTALPYAVWQLVSGSPENYLAGRPDMDGFTLQVDVYAATGASARAVGAALRDSIELRAHITRWGGESKDEATGRYRLSFDVDWLTPR
ncbi:DUF3168 domain-containing protein [Stutzerimonas frequens]|uniref:DUF3168 domain-containing protein n=1 Tax=Stutzerimonas frequens TaxID=2968969 RepID=UPI00190A06F7|nr:DUF3168 domain-containing protein [Stutzerimonas frequens]MBK3872136.1 DUF3168 domain-containing protein [Stutzerimonas frequens]MBK3910667.1 DUF3168 domain-containing protein [Stutzerimonas frequens]MBK3929928.1 DUF3168 domain-containing protein [Stutzerimonas frequens]